MIVAHKLQMQVIIDVSDVDRYVTGQSVSGQAKEMEHAKIGKFNIFFQEAINAPGKPIDMVQTSTI